MKRLTEIQEKIVKIWEEKFEPFKDLCRTVEGAGQRHRICMGKMDDPKAPFLVVETEPYFIGPQRLNEDVEQDAQLNDIVNYLFQQYTNEMQRVLKAHKGRTHEDVWFCYSPIDVRVCFDPTAGMEFLISIRQDFGAGIYSKRNKKQGGK